MILRGRARAIAGRAVQDNCVVFRPEKLDILLELIFLAEPIPPELLEETGRCFEWLLFSIVIFGSRLGMKMYSPGWRRSAELDTRRTSRACMEGIDFSIESAA
jgi:hypothetical protein